MGYGAGGGVDKLRVQVEGSGRGPARGLTGLQAGLEDLTQLWRRFLQEEINNCLTNIKIRDVVSSRAATTNR